MQQHQHHRYSSRLINPRMLPYDSTGSRKHRTKLRLGIPFPMQIDTTTTTTRVPGSAHPRVVGIVAVLAGVPGTAKCPAEDSSVAFVEKTAKSEKKQAVKRGDATLSSSTPPSDDGVFVETLEKCSARCSRQRCLVVPPSFRALSLRACIGWHCRWLSPSWASPQLCTVSLCHLRFILAEQVATASESRRR